MKKAKKEKEKKVKESCSCRLRLAKLILEPQWPIRLVCRMLVSVGCRGFCNRITRRINQRVVKHGGECGSDDAHLELGELEDEVSIDTG